MPGRTGNMTRQQPPANAGPVTGTACQSGQALLGADRQPANARDPEHHRHGTLTRYDDGPDEYGVPGKGCRCGDCVSTRRAWRNDRSRQIAYGCWQPFVPVDTALAHLEVLRKYGIGWTRAADLAGISPATISHMLYGKPPTQKIRPTTEAAILSVEPVLKTLPMPRWSTRSAPAAGCRLSPRAAGRITGSRPGSAWIGHGSAQ